MCSHGKVMTVGDPAAFSTLQSVTACEQAIYNRHILVTDNHNFRMFEDFVDAEDELLPVSENCRAG